MKRIKLYIGLLLVFVLGILCGALGTGLYIKQESATLIETRRPMRTIFLMERLDSKLDLTQAQKTKIQKILNQLEADMSEFRKLRKPEMEKILGPHWDMIRQELNSEQREIFDGLKKRCLRRGQGHRRLNMRGMTQGPGPKE